MGKKKEKWKKRVKSSKVYTENHPPPKKTYRKKNARSARVTDGEAPGYSQLLKFCNIKLKLFIIIFIFLEKERNNASPSSKVNNCATSSLHCLPVLSPQYSAEQIPPQGRHKTTGPRFLIIPSILREMVYLLALWASLSFILSPSPGSEGLSTRGNLLGFLYSLPSRLHALPPSLSLLSPFSITGSLITFNSITCSIITP